MGEHVCGGTWTLLVSRERVLHWLGFSESPWRCPWVPCSGTCRHVPSLALVPGPHGEISAAGRHFSPVPAACLVLGSQFRYQPIAMFPDLLCAVSLDQRTTPEPGIPGLLPVQQGNLLAQPSSLQGFAWQP